MKISKETTTIKLSDVAIGDFIIAMGYTNGNSVLESSRVLIISPIEPSKRRSVLGTVIEVEKNTITLDQEDNIWELNFGKKWVGPELDDINNDDQLIAAGEESESNVLEIRTIYLPQPVSPEPSPLPEEE